MSNPFFSWYIGGKIGENIGEIIKKRKEKKKMKQYPNNKRLNRPICENCHFLAEYMGQRYCRVVRPFINPETGICEDWKKKS